ncbi:MAG: NTP/NDP exchange transporter [Flavobacteriaceae bacterium]
MDKLRIQHLLLIRPSEYVKAFWAFLYFFTLLSSYFVLRPIRDEMGILNGASNMQWLFTGTFIAMLALVPIFGYLSSRFKIGSLLLFLYPFFSLNIVLFYCSFTLNWAEGVTPTVFFIWLSVFNLFAISLFWSFLVDIFTTDQSKRLFGIIAAGGSLGAICGPLLASSFANQLGVDGLFLLAATLLLVVTFSLYRLIQLQPSASEAKEAKTASYSNISLKGKSVLDGIKLVMKSRFLQKLVLYILLYTSVSTFLYFEQAHLVEQQLTATADRIRYFSRVDLITNTLAIGGQFFLTNHIIKTYGLSLALCGIPIVVGIGFMVLSTKTILVVVALLLVIHRAGNYMLMKPGREMLYTIVSREEKYKAKNFIDTAVYRGGDALTGWLFAALVSLGLGLSTIAFLAVPLISIWIYTGYQLGNKTDRLTKTVPANFKQTK